MGAPQDRAGVGGEVRFWKGQALGNDYVVLDAALLSVPLTPSLVRGLCDRHRGVGADGVLLGDVAGDAFRLRIFNPDGEEAEKSGNGLRIFGAWLHRRGLVGRDEFHVELGVGPVAMRIVGQAGDGGRIIVVAMGAPTFPGAGFTPARAVSEVPAGDAGAARAFALGLGDAGAVDVWPVSLGNPHCVVWVERLARDDFLRRAPRLCGHPAFRGGTNVQLARVAAPDVVEAWIWERGAGETLASGSSACAVAAVALERALVAGPVVRVRMPGGDVAVERDDAGVLHLRGPAQIVYEGGVAAEVVDAWMRG